MLITIQYNNLSYYEKKSTFAAVQQKRWNFLYLNITL